ncbi:MAG TPA: dihydropteroate synthase, partial [Desulfobulbaceae bacterium]|nr:dihydropteroate synthase [Desulfobulbaceae bacterium]
GLPMEARDCPTAVISALCARQGADILRVHDVGLTSQAVQLTDKIFPVS